MEFGIQDKLLSIGTSGCYFLSILKGTKKSWLDTLLLYDILIEKGLMRDDCTILNSAKVVEYLVDLPVEYKYMTEKPKYEEWKMVVEEWHNPRTGFIHFRLHNWDSLKDSVTVKEGKIKSYRCFKW